MSSSSGDNISPTAHYTGEVWRRLGEAEFQAGRSLDSLRAAWRTGTRAAWRHELGLNRSKTLDAPSWLWASVVELLVSHEGAYLEHCRVYANARSG